MRYASVSPVSTMSSTSTTSRPADVGGEVVQDRHPAGVGREPGDRHEVDVDVDVGDRAREVGEEDQRALQHADQHDAVGVIRRDLAVRGGGRADAIAVASSRTPRASTSARDGAAHRLAQQRGPQPPAETGELAERLGGARLRLGVALAPVRQEHLLEQAASRSANARYMRRCRGSIPCRMNVAADPGDGERVLVEQHPVAGGMGRR